MLSKSQAKKEIKTIQMYRNRVQNGSLEILNNLKLQNLEIFSKLDISKLTVQNCGIQKKALTSSTIKELSIYGTIFYNLNEIILENLEVLTIVSCYLNSISDINKFKNLRELDLSNNTINNISFLHSLELTKLKLQHNSIKDSSVLASLVNLRELDISYNRRIDIKPLRFLEHLIKLNISFCDVYNIDAMKTLSKIEELDISQCEGLQSYQLENQINLRKLNVSCMLIEDFRFINKIESLRELDLSDNLGIDLTKLSLVQITKLWLRNTNLKNISQFNTLVNLEHLDISNNQNIDIIPLSDLPKLIHLNLSDCNIKNLHSLKDLRLQELDISQNPGIDISALQYMSNLKELVSKKNTLKNISVLKYLINLKKLVLSQNDIDITPLQYLTQLTYLSLDSCNLHEISALRPLHNLEYLNISANLITHISPLSQMMKLTFAQVDSGDIVDAPDIEHPYIDQFSINRFEPNYHLSHQEIQQLHNVMHMIDIKSTQLRETTRKYISLKTINRINREKVGYQLQRLVQNQISFTNNIVSLFQQLNQEIYK
ncbi:leucine-rich_repeat domain-containing protein [Hexamita inflata]|uniref:Leucine-rich repeat domain-containing protein n=1 Tax=Hexamita inflata TaxID=28002 RepID=A0AA86PFD7_9EUKA|nr:leucine-rich repeat domain-containing protein [Hexamita inflata]